MGEVKEAWENLKTEWKKLMRCITFKRWLKHEIKDIMKEAKKP